MFLPGEFNWRIWVWVDVTMGANTSSKPPVFDENEDGKKHVITVYEV